MVNLAVALVLLVPSAKVTAGAMSHSLNRWPSGATVAVMVTMPPCAAEVGFDVPFMTLML